MEMICLHARSGSAVDHLHQSANRINYIHQAAVKCRMLVLNLLIAEF